MNDLKIVSKKNTSKRRLLRKLSTQGEIVIWYLLRKKFKQYHWRRQHSLGYYVADFYCHSKKLVIEIDGEYHLERKQQLYDEVRTKLFNEYGISVIRFSNEKILKNLNEVVNYLEEFLKSLN
jgi:very-short-patch-repair endonuclease